MSKALKTFLIVLLISLIVGCSTTQPSFVLFSDVIAPPERPEMDKIAGEDVIAMFKQLSENFIKAITTIERWESYQDSQDYYYTEIIVR